MKADEEIIIDVKAQADVDTKPIEKKLKRISKEFQQLAKDMANAQKMISPGTVGADYDEMSKKIDELQTLFSKLSKVAKDTSRQMKKVAKTYNTTNSIKERKKLAKELKEEMKLVRELEGVMRGYRREVKDIYDSLNLPRGPPPKEYIAGTAKEETKTTRRRRRQKDVTFEKELDVAYDTLRQTKATRMGSQLTMYTQQGIEKLFTPLDMLVKKFAGEDSAFGKMYRGFRVSTVTMSTQASVLMAKIGVIGVILKKVYEVMEKMVDYSGVMRASLKILTLIVRLSIKPVADVIGSVLLPVLMIMLKVLMPIIKNWNKIMSNWMKVTKDSKAAQWAQIANVLIGMKTGGLWGGFAGALAPMLGAYAANGTDEKLRLLSAALTVTVESFTLMPRATLKFVDSVLNAVAASGLFVKMLSFASTAVGWLIKGGVLVSGVLGRIAIVGSGVVGGLLTLVAALSLAIGYIKLLPKLIYGLMHPGTIKPDWSKSPVESWKEAISSLVGGVKELFSNPKEFLSKQKDDIYQSWAAILSPIADNFKNFFVSAATADEMLGGVNETIDEMNNVTVEADKLVTEAKGLQEELRGASGEMEGVELISLAKKLWISTITPFEQATNVWERSGPEIPKATKRLANKIVKVINDVADNFKIMKPASPFIPSQYTETIQSYDIGGLVRETGLALVHEGEYVIPRNMVDKLRDVIHNPSPIAPIVPKPIFGVPEPIYRPESNVINVSINVDHISSDYDLDRLAEEISERIVRGISRYGAV